MVKFKNSINEKTIVGKLCRSHKRLTSKFQKKTNIYSELVKAIFANGPSASRLAILTDKGNYES